MFTGIVETTGRILETRTVPGGRRLRIDAGAVAGDAREGASIAVSGVCLTVAARSTAEVSFDVITETLQRSTLGLKQVGQLVNLERSLRAGERLDGHFVQGHVDGTAAVERVVATPREHVVWLRADESLRACLIPKGSVAVDGVSLTIAEVRDDAFSVALIPTTLERTTLSTLTARDRVNIETDILARAIVHHLSRLSGEHGLTLGALREAGMV